MQDSLIICIYGYIVILITSVINNVAHFVTSNQLFVLVCLSVCWFVRLFGGLSVCLLVCLSVCWFGHMFGGLSVFFLVCPSVWWSVCLFAGFSVYL